MNFEKSLGGDVLMTSQEIEKDEKGVGHVPVFNFETAPIDELETNSNSHLFLLSSDA